MMQDLKMTLLYLSIGLAGVAGGMYLQENYDVLSIHKKEGQCNVDA